ncbi:MAG: hypothetical protein IPL35_09275 [Sphingobacteriales bacterium]|nr:hypothetical protein [Sphingobacteriales bacterium]
MVARKDLNSEQVVQLLKGKKAARESIGGTQRLGRQIDMNIVRDNISLESIDAAVCSTHKSVTSK